MKTYKTRTEIEEELIKIWNLPLATSEEKERYKLKLKYSIFYLINKTIKLKDVEIKVINIGLDAYSLYLLGEDGIKYRLTNIKLKTINPINNKEELICLGTTKYSLLNKGYFLKDSSFKSLYYLTKEYKDKCKETIEKKYGSSKVFYEKLQRKASETMLKKYNVPYFLCRGKHYEKVEEVMLEKYDCKTPMQNEKLKEKIEETMLKKYNVPYFLCRGKHYEKIEKIMLEKYGVTNIFHEKDFRKKYAFNSISKLENEVFETLLKECNFVEPNCFFISKNQVAFQNPYNAKRYYVDFFDKKLNLVIEVMGDFWHCNPDKYKKDFIHPYTKLTAEETWEKDKKRKQEIINFTGASFIEIWENDWVKYKKQIISYLKTKYKI